MRIVKYVLKDGRNYLCIPKSVNLENKEYDLDRLGSCLLLIPTDDLAWDLLDQKDFVIGYINTDCSVTMRNKSETKDFIKPAVTVSKLKLS